MGQAALDLPDPLEATTSAQPTGHPGDADDLLAQMAGEEIDRLLAEAEVEKLQPKKPHIDPPPAAPDAPAARQSAAPAPVTPPAPGPAELPSDLLDDVLDATEDVFDGDVVSPETPTAAPSDAAAIPSPTAPAAAPAAAVVAPAATPFATSPIGASATPAVAAVDDQLDALFNGRSPVQPPADAAAPPAEAPPIALDAAPAQDAAPLESSLATLAAPPAASAAPAASAEDVAAALDPEAYPDMSLPLLLRPLEWINAPFNALPDGVREALGKVALVTLFNAIAVLVYVLVFKKHS